MSCQIPASCQSRNRRQQVMPEPQPSSCGGISQGIPLRKCLLGRLGRRTGSIFNRRAGHGGTIGGSGRIRHGGWSVL